MGICCDASNVSKFRSFDPSSKKFGLVLRMDKGNMGCIKFGRVLSMTNAFLI